MIDWKKWNQQVIEKTHGKINFYRDLYEGKHSKIFDRAVDLINKGEITDQIYYGSRQAKNVQTPYVMANLSKLIPEIPATFVSRSIGSINTSLNVDDNTITNETDDDLDTQETESPQQEIIEQISKNSNIKYEHWGNVVQHQVDGGLVGVPFFDDRGMRIEFKQRDVYFPHQDGMGVDLAYEIQMDEGDKEETYLHVYRERIEPDGLRAENFLYKVTSDVTELLSEDEAKEKLNKDELNTFYPGRSNVFVEYWPNEKTPFNPLGRSCLQGQENKQDEINWTLTRNAITYERNGKPRIAVSKEVMEALQEKAMDRYGDENLIDHRDLELTTFDDNGKALEVVQIDVTKIGDITWVKELARLMLLETRTSQKAADFFMEDSAGAESGVSKFWDLLTSIMKSEQLQGEYIHFLKRLYENCLWIMSQDDPGIVVEEPEVEISAMLPVSRKELTEENAQSFSNGIQSLETTLRRNNPTASEEWIQEELIRIEEGKTPDDSTSLNGVRSTLTNFLDNRVNNNAAE